jgi:hypothetical protein
MEEKRLNCIVSADLYRAFYMKAVSQGTTMSDLIRKFIEKYVKEEKSGD